MNEPREVRELDVRRLAADPRLNMRVIAGERGMTRLVRHPRVQKNGLALAGHFHGVVPTRVQLLGETELSFLASLPEDQKGHAVRAYCALGLSCIVVTKGGPAPVPLVQACEASGTPLLISEERTSATINIIHAVLDDELAPTTSLHGVLVDVFGVGLLLLGKSGIGKSECALELVLRGHRLVADDIVMCDFRPPNMVFGEPAPVLRHHMEIRGLGILNIKDMFGVTAVRERKRIDVVVRLSDWQEDAEYDRLGVDDAHDTILGTRIRMLHVPVRPGRDMGSILEIAARNELLRRAGTHSAKNFIDRLQHPTRPSRQQGPLPESMLPAPTSRQVPQPESSHALFTPEAAPSAPWAVRSSARTTTHERRMTLDRSVAEHDNPTLEPEESSAWIPRAAHSHTALQGAGHGHDDQDEGDDL
jgi:HPr kinase/phosphorylase